MLSTAPKFMRADGPDKVTGSGRYAADLSFAGMAAAKFRYAGVSHARITRIDTSPAMSMPGVLAVITADDVPNVRFAAPIADRTLFAREFVRFEGEILAAVAATTPAIAEAACLAIIVEYEPLPSVNQLEAALAEDSPLVHPDLEDYGVPEHLPHGRNVAAHSRIEHGDADAAMATADHVITSRYSSDASHAVPIEPRSVVAQWEGNKVTIWTSTQVPYAARNGVCKTLKLPSNRVRVIVPHLGGGFGGKCGFHYEAHVAALARKAQRPTKLVFSRREEFTAPDRRREEIIFEITSGITNDGKIVARTADILVDNGAYSADSSFFAQAAAMHVAGPYQIPNIRIDARLVYTNRQPSGSVRAPTAPQSCWATESHANELAAAVGLDPLQFRLNNVVKTGTAGVLGQVYDQIGLDQCLEAAAKSAGWGRQLPEDEALGVAVGWWPSFASPAGAYAKMHGDGKVQIVTGAQECGTGSVMTLRILAAAELGIDEEDIELVYQDTAAAPVGPGSSGSQTLFNHGRAVQAAAAEVASQIKALAAEQLEAAPEDIVLEGGKASVVGSPSVAVEIDKIAARAAGGDLLLGRGSATMPERPQLSDATCLGDQGFSAWLAPQFSCHVARVRLDRDTGVVRVLEVHAAHDSGTIINPMAATGQVEGGVMMGVGQAITEGTRYDEQGRQLNASLLEYKLATIADAPEITTTFIEIPTANAGPNGAKGLAEAPNVPTAGAIANAISTLIGRPVRQLPMTGERVWETMETASSDDSTTSLEKQ